MRTNLENSMSEEIALKNGFEVIEGKIETVFLKEQGWMFRKKIKESIYLEKEQML